MDFLRIKKSVFFGILAAAILPLFYFALSFALTRSLPHSLERLDAMKWWIIVFSLGLGAQFGLMKYHRLQCGKTRVWSAIFSGGSGTFSMLACCAHHLADFAVIGASSGFIAFSLKYQNAMLWFGLTANILGTIYILRQIKFSKKLSSNNI